MDEQLTKETKELPHDRDVCQMESRYYLVKLLDEKHELHRVIMIKFIIEHLNHLK